MALTLNTNIDSLTAQNNLGGSQALLSQSLTRLSSGLRINSAADDAAGLAISQGFTTENQGGTGTPEPASFFMGGCGLVALALIGRRRIKKPSMTV